jgi:hypothetical protein
MNPDALLRIDSPLNGVVEWPISATEYDKVDFVHPDRSAWIEHEIRLALSI